MSSKKRNNEASFFRSIGFRLTRGYVIVLSLSIIAITVYLYHSLNFTLQREIMAFLEGESAYMNTFISRNYDQRNLIINELNQRISLAKGTYDLYYALFDMDGNILAKSEGFAEDATAIRHVREKRAAGKTVLDAGQESRITGYEGSGILLVSRVVTLSAQPIYFLQLGVSLRHVEQILWNYWLTVFLAVPVVLLIAACGGYFLARHYLKPIIGIIDAARQVSLADDTETYLPLRHTGDELDLLAQTFNDVFKKLAGSYKKIAQFTADASHEMRIPITTLKGEAAVVLERERNVEEYQRVLESSVEEYDRLTQMLNDLLVLSRSDLGEEKIMYAAVDLSSLIRHLGEFMEALADARGIRFVYAVDDGVTVYGNKIMIERLSSNILDNAIKYSFDEKPIHIMLTREGGQAKIVITNTGIGIPAESLPHIFDRFYRVDKARSREHGGTGLGLSISKMIVDAHHGTITIQSEEGKETAVTILLPLNKDS